jgi:hypothetical protein
LDLVGESLDDVRKGGESLNTWIPWLLGDVGESFVLQRGVFLEPLVELNDFERIGRSGESLSQERIEIESEGRDERIDLVGEDFCWLRLSFRRCRLLQRRNKLSPAGARPNYAIHRGRALQFRTSSYYLGATTITIELVSSPRDIGRTCNSCL